MLLWLATVVSGCVLEARHLTLTELLSSKVYKRIPVNGFNAGGGNPAID